MPALVALKALISVLFAIIFSHIRDVKMVCTQTLQLWHRFGSVGAKGHNWLYSGLTHDSHRHHI